VPWSARPPFASFPVRLRVPFLGVGSARFRSEIFPFFRASRRSNQPSWRRDGPSLSARRVSVSSASFSGFFFLPGSLSGASPVGWVFWGWGERSLPSPHQITAFFLGIALPVFFRHRFTDFARFPSLSVFFTARSENSLDSFSPYLKYATKGFNPLRFQEKWSGTSLSPFLTDFPVFRDRGQFPSEEYHFFPKTSFGELL